MSVYADEVLRRADDRLEHDGYISCIQQAREKGKIINLNTFGKPGSTGKREKSYDEQEWDEFSTYKGKGYSSDDSINQNENHSNQRFGVNFLYMGGFIIFLLTLSMQIVQVTEERIYVASMISNNFY